MDQCVFPTEIIFHIFDFCDMRTKLHFKNTCSDMRNSFYNATLWHMQYNMFERVNGFRFYAKDTHIKTVESESIKLAAEKFFKNSHLWKRCI